MNTSDGKMTINLPRRKFLHLAAGAAALPAVSRVARAQAYPTKSVRLIVGFPAGGTTDILARLMAEWLSGRLGQRFTVENRPGAASNIAAEAAIKSPPDGYTLLMISSVNAINATLYDRLNFDSTRDIAPVAGIMRLPNVMAVPPSLRVNTVPEFIAYAKARPDKIKMASVGFATRLSGELFKMMTGISMAYVPNGNAVAMLTGLFGGQTQVAFEGLTSLIEHIRTKKLRALAVTTATRAAALPEIPTVGDFVRGYEASAWFGIAAPGETPGEIVDKLNKEINASLADPEIKGRLAILGGAALAASPAEFGKLIAEETEKWAQVIKFSSAKPG
jgi:tripartite-type tricarboxylate transporter receptor subunit TctC